MSLIRISESEDFFVDYDKDRGMYRVSTFNPASDYIDKEYWFDCYEEKELKTPEEIIELYWQIFMSGAAKFMDYMKNNYSNGVSQSEMEDILVEFLKQFGEVRNIGA